MPVLITAGLSPEAYRLQRVLAITDVVFSSETPIPHIPGAQSIVLPGHTSPSFVHEVLKACLDLRMTRVYPLIRGEVLELSKARTLFSEYSIIIMIPSELWLKENVSKSYARMEHISILENGRVLAGSELPPGLSLAEETGIFTWATLGQKLQYTLYLV